MSHTQFNRDSRVELAILLNAKKNQTECAKILGMHRINVCLEINRNKDPDGVYRGVHAHKRYLKRRLKAKCEFRKIENDEKLRELRKDRRLWMKDKELEIGRVIPLSVKKRNKEY